jgi:hypothetical protein
VRTPVRLALVVLGLVAVVYGAAPFVGIGMPSWWWTDPPSVTDSGPESRMRNSDARDPQLGRETYSLCIATVGVALVIAGAWPRRRVDDEPWHRRASMRRARRSASLPPAA